MEDTAVGNVLKVKSKVEQDTPCHQVETVSKQVKVGRSLASKTLIRTSCTKKSSTRAKSSCNIVTCYDGYESENDKRSCDDGHESEDDKSQ